MTPAPTLTLFSKPGCHLCEDARLLIDELQPEFGYAVEEIDITLDQDLFACYRYEIPVVALDGEELSRGKLNELELVSLLRTC